MATLAKGAEVEASSDEDGFRGAWFEAKVVRCVPPLRRLVVQYHTLVTDDGDDDHPPKPLRETVSFSHVRPRPPFSRIPPSGGFLLGQPVEAFHNDGWWVGRVLEVIHGRGGRRYNVGFEGSEEVLEIAEGELRPHFDWNGDEWVEPEFDKPLSGIGQEKQDVKFTKGSLVEVNSDEEGFIGSSYAATIIKTMKNNKFLVEYVKLKADNEIDPLREFVDSLNIRPMPPIILRIKAYKRLEEVDAWYNDGWWVGVVSKVLENLRYVVYFRHSKEELEFDHSELRAHQEWIDGKWVRASKV
ncbi:hypothetical protein QJS10_CPB04g01035 [Acorus calamus]|uniref:Agenet domain-containing protein n=1 Tax=Acorus calamus TaxID=4465 RepID=A0AAV9EXN2_ACOCL|nr:hypothetical protein QJS10_CPB04g01035 [Acorus calamus]